mmetsp:Transcript_49370/g.115515  ORF Transcript_49370/g.115515 Transcript_49370/m.115515 type:complete len:223 (-) Transcript_49370:114-782(-)
MVALRLAMQPSSRIIHACCSSDCLADSLPSAGGVSKRLCRDSARIYRVRSLARLHCDDAQFRCVQPRQHTAKLARVRSGHRLHLTGLRQHGLDLHHRLRRSQLRAQRDRALIFSPECVLVLFELALSKRDLLLRRAELSLEVWLADRVLELATLLLARRFAQRLALSARVDTWRQFLERSGWRQQHQGPLVALLLTVVVHLSRPRGLEVAARHPTGESLPGV